MKTSKAFFVLLSLLVFPLSLIRPNETIGDVKEELSIAQKQDRSRKYLMSLDHPDLSVSDSEINYSVRLRPGNQGNVAACSSGEATEYSFKYIKMLDLVAIDSEGKTYYGYPFINSKGEKDVLLEADGIRSVYSESTEQFGFASIPITITKPDTRIPTEPVVYPLMKIVSELANFDDVQGIAKIVIDVPDIIIDGPINFFLYSLKLKMILADYAMNKTAKYQPEGPINGQGTNDFDEWVFGINYTKSEGFQAGRGNFKNNGCGIIAIYNMLFQSGAKPDLASIIALTQLCNADLVLGAFGVNPINKEIIDEVRIGAKILYESVLTSLVGAVMLQVAQIIYENMIKKIIEEPWWVCFMIGTCPALAGLVVETILVSLRATFVAANLILHFVDDYLRNLGDLSQVVRFFLGNQYTQIDCLNLEDFINNVTDYSQGVITFWNELNNDGRPDVLQGAHTVYMEKSSSFQLSVYNYGNKETKAAIFPLISLNWEKPFGEGTQYIYGYVWKKAEES